VEKADMVQPNPVQEQSAWLMTLFHFIFQNPGTLNPVNKPERRLIASRIIFRCAGGNHLKLLL